MNTETETEIDISMGLLMRYKKPVVTLEVAAQDWLPHININIARRRARTQTLPFPVFKTEESNKSTYLVYIADIAAWLEQSREQARTDWKKMND